jgi:hypothetical protein
MLQNHDVTNGQKYIAMVYKQQILVLLRRWLAASAANRPMQ